MKGGIHETGGAQQFYTGTTRDASSPGVPTIVTGMDLHAILRVSMPSFSEMIVALQTGQPIPVPDKDKVNAELARLPDSPDENLR
jgi:hypothetical protein